MKKLLVTLYLMSSAACTMHTPQGKCIGLATEDQKRPGLNYQVNWWNVFVGALFLETVIVPAYVLIDDLKCPE